MLALWTALNDARHSLMRATLPSTFFFWLALAGFPAAAAAQQAAPPADTREQQLYVCCRRLQGFWGWISFQRHCSLVIAPDLSQRGDTYGLYLRQEGGIPDENEPSDGSRNRGSCQRLASSSSHPDQMQQLVAAARRLQRQPESPDCRSCGSRYRLFRRNSNTYVSDLLRSAGFQPPRRWCAPGYGRPAHASVAEPAFKPLIHASYPELRRIGELSLAHGWSFLAYDPLGNQVLHVERGHTRRIFPLGDQSFRLGHHAYPSLSRDGRRIAYVRPSGAHLEETIVLFDLQTNSYRDLLQWPSRIWGLAWSPAGDEIAFIADKDSLTGLFLLRVQDGSVTEWTLKPEISTDAAPSWSPDGQAIALQRDVGTDAEIVVLQRGSDRPRRLTEGRFPAWSLHGDVIGFIDLEGSRSWSIPAAGGATRELFSPPKFTQELVSQPVWSPDGDQMVFHRTHGIKGSSRVIFLVEAGTGKRRRIYTGDALEILAWRLASPPQEPSPSP